MQGTWRFKQAGNLSLIHISLIIVHKLPKELGNYWFLKIVAMQIIAANLGSMLTPVSYTHLVKICKIDTDKELNLALQYKVASIPTLLLFKNGEVAATNIGLSLIHISGKWCWVRYMM